MAVQMSVEDTEKLARRTKKSMKTVSEEAIGSWLASDSVQAYVHGIHEGKVQSWRHDMYVAGPPKIRAGMKFKYGLGNILLQEQTEYISHHLLKIFCKQGIQQFGYTMDVLVPEVVIKLLMERCHLSYQEAEQLSQVTISDEEDKGPTVMWSTRSSSVHPQPSSVMQSGPSSHAAVNLCEYNALELATLTGNFSVLIGKGGVSCVYKGQLNSIPLAVKMYDEDKLIGHGLDVQVQLREEVLSLTRFQHPNLVQLMGYCNTPPALIFPFMERLSLYHCLHAYKIDHRLAWSERKKILSGSACGLAYLHSSTPPFVHHDVKSHNILLDATLTPKVADFGFVTPMPVNVGNTAIVTAAGAITLAGSRGYTAPEFTEGRHGIRSDVYSYGVVVLETFSGLLTYSEERENEKLVDHCEEEMASVETFRSVADNKAGPVDPGDAMRFWLIAKGTLRRNHKKRILMNEVMDMWENNTV